MRYLRRHLEQPIREAAGHFKAVLLLGARQVGKSTLLSHLFPDVKTFVFDPIQDLYNARKDPDLFLQSFPPPLILDDVQYVPELLAALKRKMDQTDAKGQYFLTGSQNLNVLRQVSESMAGRVAVFQLDSFTPEEILGHGGECGWLPRYLEDPSCFYKDRPKMPPAFFPLTEFLFRGTLPGTVELPTSQISNYFRSYLQTYVDRDVRSQEEVRQIAEFDRFLGLSAALTAQEINPTQLGREIGISPSTARRWLDLFTFSYQWFELSPFHGNSIKRISGKKKGYFKDPGFACYLQKIDSPASLAVHPRLGAIFETWVVNWILQQCASIPLGPSCYHWRTTGGAEVDLVLEKNGLLYPIEIKCKTNLTKTDCSGLKAFLKTYPHKQIQTALIIYAGTEVYQLDEQTLAIPWTLL